MGRKDEILDALIDIFKNQGIGSDFTMSQLAEKVDIGKSTIYEYFKTKEEVVQQAIYRVVDSAVDTIHNTPQSDGDFETQFKSEISRLFNLALGSRFMFSLISPEFKRLMSDKHRGEMNAKMQGVSKFYQDRFTAIFTFGITEGLLSPNQVQENQLLIMSLVIGSIIQLANANMNIGENLDIDSYINKVYYAVLKITN